MSVKLPRNSHWRVPCVRLTAKHQSKVTLKLRKQKKYLKAIPNSTNLFLAAWQIFALHHLTSCLSATDTPKGKKKGDRKESALIVASLRNSFGLLDCWQHVPACDGLSQGAQFVHVEGQISYLMQLNSQADFAGAVMKFNIFRSNILPRKKPGAAAAGLAQCLRLNGANLSSHT